jgi:Zn-dependent alcohol dehydrogenase
MDVRAVVAPAAGAALALETVQLDGPKAGELLKGESIRSAVIY